MFCTHPESSIAGVVFPAQLAESGHLRAAQQLRLFLPLLLSDLLPVLLCVRVAEDADQPVPEGWGAPRGGTPSSIPPLLSSSPPILPSPPTYALSPPQIPEWQTYKVANAPELQKTERMLASLGLKVAARAWWWG